MILRSNALSAATFIPAGGIHYFLCHGPDITRNEPVFFWKTEIWRDIGVRTRSVYGRYIWVEKPKTILQNMLKQTENTLPAIN